ncbi:MAG TPA: hypothetical protein VIJ23_16465 [Mycobacterium sp.]
MTDDAGPATAGGVACDVYEFRIAGTIGAVVRSALPEFSAVVVPRSTVLTGTFHGPEDLQRLLDALDAHGPPPVDVRLIGHTDAAAQPRSDTADRDEPQQPCAAVQAATDPGRGDPRVVSADPIGAD